MGGWISDQVGARVTAMVSGLVSAAGLMLVPVVLAAPLSGVWTGAAFSALVILWSLGAAAQGPALTALAQELSPPGKEATALALPRASGDGVYIIAPFLLGLIADVCPPGFECAVAGTATAMGVLALGLLGAGPAAAAGEEEAAAPPSS